MIVIATIGTAIADFWLQLIVLARGFTVKDVIDVAIVTVLIYSVIKLVRETRAGQLVKGLIMFIVIFLVSQLLQLGMLNTILKYFFQFASFAILIVFQPELRKALEQMGRSNVGKSIVNVVGAKDRESANVLTKRAINTVVDAASILQRLKMGALIVFEKTTKLGEIAETGTIMDSQPSAQLIANVFFNKAPLHDGAMIIRNGRLLCAGCVLPLTKNDTLSAELGMRHRAALGISEESDAVVVVVSEETGQFSLVSKGIITRDYNRDTLRAALDSALLSLDEAQAHGASKFSLIQKIRGKKTHE